MPAIRPNLWFDGDAEEAVDFYLSVFPNDLVAINGGLYFTFNEAVSLEILCEDQAGESTTTGRPSRPAEGSTAGAVDSRAAADCPGRRLCVRPAAC
jgi:hypothetical protein